ncbi:MAG: alanine dehydrogenase [Acidobacteria bacterium]|nr:alanine dehydrogenase [Acidobacteriota bacterium]MCI0623259.1 alanine dehydrogenase [Acidobacteriota bacterium]MCI0723953.1 alanine dehydrogenase [Acidobacteriota bacterium]
MIVGIPKEVKDNEYRVGMVPAGVKALTEAGHRVLLEEGAGAGSGIFNEEYVQAGGTLASCEQVWSAAEMIVKVKEPVEPEYPRLRERQILFTYLHLAPLPGLTRVLLEKRVVGIAYETIKEADGSLPLLTPMSEVAGRMAIQIGAQYLEKSQGGRGILLSGVPGVPPAQVVILGGGIVGLNSAKSALGMGAHVTVLDNNVHKLRYLDDVFLGRVATLASNSITIAHSIRKADLLVGAVLVPGASAPKLVTRQMISTMKKGAVIVDVAVDQGGCIETSHPTTHSHPTFQVDGVLHYCVANMPGAVPRTSTFALTNATLPYVMRLAKLGVAQAVRSDAGLAEGLNVFDGHVTYRAVAESQGIPYRPVLELLN